MANLTTFNSIGGFGVGENKTLVIDSNANVIASSVVSTGDISATGNIVTAGYFQGDGSLLTGIAPTVQVYEFANVVSTGGYYEAQWLGTYVPGAVANIVTTVADTETLMGAFITESGYPYVDVIPTGTILVRVESIKLSGSRSYTMFARIYARDTNGTETLVATTDSTSPTVDNTLIQQNLIAYIAGPVSINKTDRIVAKVYATLSQGTASIALNFDDNTGSGLQMPALPAAISTFVPYTGATANVNLDGKTVSAGQVTANTKIQFGNGSTICDRVVTTSSTSQATLFSSTGSQSYEVLVSARDTTANTTAVCSLLIAAGSNTFVEYGKVGDFGTFDADGTSGDQWLKVTPDSANTIVWSLLVKGVGSSF